MNTSVANAARAAAMMSRYQSVSCARMLLGVSALRITEDIPDAAHRLDQAGLAGDVDLVAQMLDVDIDDVARAIEREVPDVFGDHRARQHGAGAPHEVLEQRVLARGDRHRAAVAHDRACGGIERHAADRDRDADAAVLPPA